MGTRGLTCVVVDGEMKVMQYGQWDHYPSGQGVTVLAFLRDRVANNEIVAFADKCRAVVELDSDTFKQLWVDAGADPDSDLVSMKVSDRFREANPHLSRDAGAEVLTHIWNGASAVQLDRGFVKDSLFCEWAYVVDLDAKRLEVFRGFQQSPHNKGRFASPEPNGDGYYPVAEIARFSFDDLPSDEVFCEVCESQESDA